MVVLIRASHNTVPINEKLSSDMPPIASQVMTSRMLPAPMLREVTTSGLTFVPLLIFLPGTEDSALKITPAIMIMIPVNEVNTGSAGMK